MVRGRLIESTLRTSSIEVEHAKVNVLLQLFQDTRREVEHAVKHDGLVPLGGVMVSVRCEQWVQE
jgi:hypothetical protein